MTHLGMEDVNTYIVASKNVLELFKVMASMLPKGEKHGDIETRMQDAERALKAAEVQLAHSLGYKLCQCTFPPQIMLSTGRHPTNGEEIFKCGACNKQHPSEAHFRTLDRNNEAYSRQSEGGWMSR